MKDKLTLSSQQTKLVLFSLICQNRCEGVGKIMQDKQNFLTGQSI